MNFRGKRRSRTWLAAGLGLAAAMAVLTFLPIAAAAFTSTIVITKTARADLSNKPQPPLAATNADFQVHNVILGQGQNVQTLPILDTAHNPVPALIVTFVLQPPIGQALTYYSTTNAQGIAPLNLSAAILNKLGSYRLTSSAHGLSPLTKAFLVISQTKGDVAVGPNPFAPQDAVYNRVNFVLADVDPGAVLKLQIFSLNGAKVFSQNFLGSETVSWDGRNFNGRVVPGGIYIWQISRPGKNSNGTLVVVR